MYIYIYYIYIYVYIYIYIYIYVYIYVYTYIQIYEYIHVHCEKFWKVSSTVIDIVTIVFSTTAIRTSDNHPRHSQLLLQSRHFCEFPPTVAPAESAEEDDCLNFSKVSSLFKCLCKVFVKLTFENFYWRRQQQQRAPRQRLHWLVSNVKSHSMCSFFWWVLQHCTGFARLVTLCAPTQKSDSMCSWGTAAHRVTFLGGST